MKPLYEAFTLKGASQGILGELLSLDMSLCGAQNTEGEPLRTEASCSSGKLVDELYVLLTRRKEVTWWYDWVQRAFGGEGVPLNPSESEQYYNTVWRYYGQHLTTGGLFVNTTRSSRDCFAKSVNRSAFKCEMFKKLPNPELQIPVPTSSKSAMLSFQTN